MGVSKQQATENRKAIVAAAEKLFRERGIDGVGLNELMNVAGFTQGGFYNHFESKETLAAEVVATAMTDANHRLEADIAAPLVSRENRIERQIHYYLSTAHCADIDHGCAAAGLAADVRRLGKPAQAHFAENLQVMINTLTDLVGEVASTNSEVKEVRQQAIAFYCEMVGALMLARAVANVDQGFADEILAASRKTLLDGSTGYSSANRTPISVKSRKRRLRHP
jgi:TetR/AcrR family transcriptional repressor of nem operon